MPICWSNLKVYAVSSLTFLATLEPTLPPFGHIGEVMLVWRHGNINWTLSVLQYCVLLWWCTKVRAVLTGRLTVLGFDLAWFSSLSSERLCIFGLHGAKVRVKYVDLYSASSRSAANALPHSVSWRSSPQANSTARHQQTMRDHAIRVGVSRDMPVYSPSLRQVLIQPGQAQAE